MSQDNSTTLMRPLFVKIEFMNSKLDDVLLCKIHRQHVWIKPKRSVSKLQGLITKIRSSLAYKQKKKKMGVELEELALQ